MVYHATNLLMEHAMPDITNTSGGVNLNSERTDIAGDVVGRDKVTDVHGDQVFGDKNVNAAPDPLAQYLHHLPPAPSDFVGREAEQHDLLNPDRRRRGDYGSTRPGRHR